MMEDPKGRARLEAEEARFNKALEQAVQRIESERKKKGGPEAEAKPMEDVQEELVDSLRQRPKS